RGRPPSTDALVGRDHGARHPRHRGRPTARRPRRPVARGPDRGRRRSVGRPSRGGPVTTPATELHLLRYVPGDRAVHRMCAGTKLVVVAAVGIAAVTRPSWSGQGIALLVLVLALAAARVPLTAVPRMPKWFALALALGGALALTS